MLRQQITEQYLHREVTFQVVTTTKSSSTFLTGVSVCSFKGKSCSINRTFAVAVSMECSIETTAQATKMK